MNRADWYARVNSVWNGVTVPPLTDDEALRAAKKLFRFAGVTFPRAVKFVTGNRHTWVRRGVLSINTSRGWGSLTHMLSHWFHHTQAPKKKPHDRDHARLEIRLRKEVLKRGWLSGGLRKEPAPARVDDPAVKLAKAEAHAAAMLRKAETRLKRATTIRDGWKKKLARIQRKR